MAQSLGCALQADRTQLALVVDLRTVLDEEALHTGELVSLCGKYDHVEVVLSEVPTLEFETARVIGVINVD